jgi:hypothetical protein
MRFTLITSLLAIAGLSTASSLLGRQYDEPAPPCPICPVTQVGDYVWQLSNFTSREEHSPGSFKISFIEFNIKATNGGSLDFLCSSDTDIDTIEDNTFYECGANSFIYFAWQSDINGVMLSWGFGPA